MRSKYILLTIHLLCTCALMAQWPVFSQYTYNPAYSNAALTAYQHKLFAVGQYKTLQIGSSDAPLTAMASAQMRMGLHAAGLTLIHDVFGLQTLDQVHVQYAYRFDIGAGTIAAGTDLSYSSDQYRLTASAPKDLNDPLLSSNIRSNQFNVGAGVAWENEHGYFGFSTPGMLRAKSPFTSAEPIPDQFHLIGSYRIDLNPQFDVTPSLWFGFMEGQPSMVNVQTQIRWYELLQLDLGYRSSGAYTAGLRIAVQEKWMIGYAYEYHTAFSSAGAGSGHELMLSYFLPVKKTDPD